MKRKFTVWMTMAAIVWSMTSITACDDDDKPENPQKAIEASWSVGSTGFVKQDGVDVTSDYAGLALTISNDGTYTAANAKKLFFPTGTWSWQGTGISKFVMNGDLEVTVTELSKTTLHMQFHMDESHVNPNGRNAAVVGDYDVLLTAQ